MRGNLEFVRWVLLWLGLTTVQSRANSGEVVVVLSSRAQAYAEAGQVLERQLKGCGFRTQIVCQTETTDWQPAKSAPPRAVVAVGSQAATGLRARIGSLQLVYCMVADPKSAGLTGQPQTAGVTSTVPVRPQLDLIREALPECRTIGMLYRSDSTAGLAPDQVREALPQPLKLTAVDVAKCGSVAAAIDQLLDSKPGLVWTSPDSAVFDAATVRTLLLRCLRAGVPVFGFSESFVRAGALLGVGVEPETLATQAAELLCPAADGKEPKALPTEPVAPRFAISVNLKVAEHLHVKLPESILARAKQVVQTK